VAGFRALFFNTVGSGETAVGVSALAHNTSGNYNTATGLQALNANTTGQYNSALGVNALANNTTAGSNTAAGYNALGSNTTGYANSAAGVGALGKNTTGINNTAIGVSALDSNTTGANNVALGVLAGHSLTIGNNNIEIGNPGLAAETNAIRIGKQGTQTQTYIAGISGAPVTGVDVVVDASGRLGVAPSAARFKHDIRNMGEASSELLKLRPVTFRYNNDPSGTLRYGLVAEEVARVYPQLVVYGPDGKVLTVRYSELSAMLLNELQKQNAQLRRLSEQSARDKAAVERKVAELEARHQRDLQVMQSEFARRLSALERAQGGGSPRAVRF
jgi:hypothetical protein